MFKFLRPGGARPAQITPTEAVARASKGELVVIDVREVAEVRASGKAKGALVIPSGLVGIKCDPSAPDCPKGLSLYTPVALYCASGARSGMAAAALQKLGYKTVYNLGGFADWKAGGGAVEKA